MKTENDKTGFSLTEILMVLVLTGAMLAFAIPQYEMVVERSKMREGEMALQALYAAQKRYYIEHNNTYALYPSDLDTSIPFLKYFGPPTGNIYDVTATQFKIQLNRNSIEIPFRVISHLEHGVYYVLTIDETGTISCSASGTTCEKLGI